MPENKNERAKVYVVIGLALLLVIVGYFRFIHKKKVTPAVPRIPSPAASLRFDIPQIKIPDRQNARSRESLSKESMRAPIRNIFTPLKLQAKVKSQPASQKPSKALPSKVRSQPTGQKLKLKGTIVGGGKAIAIINDQFVRKGDWIGKYKVVRIGKKRVLLESANAKIELEIVKSE
jgi:hypothetical protein